MKDTYYKLNRMQLEQIKHRDVISWKDWLEGLINRGILEEVQEEEMYSDGDNTPEESKQAIDNMFGNPLGQVDNMIEGTKVEEGHQLEGVCGICTSNVKLSSSDPSIGIRCRKYKAVKGRPESKPFLDGMTPSYWIYTELFKSMETERDDLNRDQIRMDIIERCLDLLVEELKRNNYIK